MNNNAPKTKKSEDNFFRPFVRSTGPFLFLPLPAPLNLGGGVDWKETEGVNGARRSSALVMVADTGLALKACAV